MLSGLAVAQKEKTRRGAGKAGSTDMTLGICNVEKHK